MHFLAPESILILWQFEDLQECYLSKRRRMSSPQKQRQIDLNSKKEKEISHKSVGNAGLEDFQSILNAFTRYRFTLQTPLAFIILHCMQRHPWFCD